MIWTHMILGEAFVREIGGVVAGIEWHLQDGRISLAFRRCSLLVVCVDKVCCSNPCFIRSISYWIDIHSSFSLMRMASILVSTLHELFILCIHVRSLDWYMVRIVPVLFRAQNPVGMHDSRRYKQNIQFVCRIGGVLTSYGWHLHYGFNSFRLRWFDMFH